MFLHPFPEILQACDACGDGMVTTTLVLWTM